MQTLRLDLGERSYSIHVGRNLEATLGKYLDNGRRAVAIVDAHLLEVQSARLDRYLGDIPRLVVPRGEGSKTLYELERLSQALLELGLARDGLLIAVGGGVTGDLCGMLAASYFRGIPFIQLPTTLLAQVDSSVGGKVAVNLPAAKNALGFFHQPEAVIADLAFLDTLELREKRAGLAETIKIAAVADPIFLDRIESGLDEILDDNGEELSSAVYHACELKAEIVKADERESGLREILNFGHTLGHAVESAGLDPAWLHGEAIALGMLAALRLGEKSGFGEPAMLNRMETLLDRAALPLRLPEGLDPSRIIELMDRDKKRRAGKLRWVLLNRWGQAHWGRDLPPEDLAATLQELRT